eukprot:6205412-Pleurochrysis_carterae.AAC.2
MVPPKEVFTALDDILREARLLQEVLLLVLATMRPRRKQDAAPKPASGYNISGRFGVYTSGRAGTWSRQRTCVPR